MIVSSRRAVQYNLLAIRFLAIAVRDTWDRVCVFTLGATRPRLGIWFRCSGIPAGWWLADDDVKYLTWSWLEVQSFPPARTLVQKKRKFVGVAFSRAYSRQGPLTCKARMILCCISVVWFYGGRSSARLSIYYRAEVWGPEHFSKFLHRHGGYSKLLLLSIYFMTRLVSLFLVVICSDEFQGVRISRRHGVKDDG